MQCLKVRHIHLLYKVYNESLKLPVVVWLNIVIKMYIYIISLSLNCTVRPHGLVTSHNENRSSLRILHIVTNLKRFTCARKDQPQKAQFRYVMPATDNSGKQDLKEFKLFFFLFFLFWLHPFHPPVVLMSMFLVYKPVDKNSSAEAYKL